MSLKPFGEWATNLKENKRHAPKRKYEYEAFYPKTVSADFYRADGGNHILLLVSEQYFSGILLYE